jgi:hypothetical protein
MTQNAENLSSKENIVEVLDNMKMFLDNLETKMSEKTFSGETQGEKKTFVDEEETHFISDSDSDSDSKEKEKDSDSDSDSEKELDSEKETKESESKEEKEWLCSNCEEEIVSDFFEEKREQQLKDELNNFVEKHIYNFFFERLHVTIISGLEKTKSINVDYNFFEKIYPYCSSLQYDNFQKIVEKAISTINELYEDCYHFVYIHNIAKIVYDRKCEADSSFILDNIKSCNPLLLKYANDYLRLWDAMFLKKIERKDYDEKRQKLDEVFNRTAFAQYFFLSLSMFLSEYEYKCAKISNNEEITVTIGNFELSTNELNKAFTVDNFDSEIFFAENSTFDKLVRSKIFSQNCIKITKKYHVFE